MVERFIVGCVILMMTLFILWRHSRRLRDILICTGLTVIIMMAVIFMPKIEPIDMISSITVTGYKYYKDEIVYVVTTDDLNYEMYSEQTYEIGTVCFGQYAVSQGNQQRNMIKEDAQQRMVINGINGRIYEDTSVACEVGSLSVGMRINRIRDQYIQHILNQTIHDYKYDMLTLAIGNKSYIDSTLFDGLQKLGIYHLYVISGTHVAFLTAVLYFFLKRMRIALEYIKVILIVVLLVFMFLNLFSPSVVRAVLMAVLLLSTSFFKKKPYLTIISLTAIVQVLYHPNIIYHAGFQLSYVTTYFILLTRRYVLNRHPLAQLFAITVISEISTLLLLLVHFNEISISGIVMNLIFVPFFSVIIFPSVILFNFLSVLNLTFIFDVLFHYLFSTLKTVILYLSTVIQHRMNIVDLTDMSIVILLITTITAIMAICKNQIKHIVISIVVFLSAVLINQYVAIDDFKVTMIDVGQGDAFLIQDLKNNKAVLIDTGGRYYYETPQIRLSDRTILPYLKQSGVNRLDLVILSHIDLDHVGEFDHIESKVPIDYVMANIRDPAFHEFWAFETSLIDPLDNRNIEIGNININVLHPFDETKVNDSNDSSIVIHVSLNDYTILFTGDAGIETEKKIVDAYNLSGVDILKVGHHGSETSTSKAFIKWTRPKIALISAGVDNRYGHPHAPVIESLGSRMILSTPELGMVQLTIRGHRMCIDSKLGNVDACVVK